MDFDQFCQVTQVIFLKTNSNLPPHLNLLDLFYKLYSVVKIMSLMTLTLKV